MNETAASAVQTITSGATATQIVQLFLLGAIAIVGVAWFVKFLLEQRVGNLPEELRKVDSAIDKLTIKVTRIEGKLWSREEIRDAIKAEITEHEHNCPCRNKRGA